MKKVRWLLAGAGNIANTRVAAALAQADASLLTAICDPIADRADSLAARMQVKDVYYDYDEALAKTDADAVYIATPHHLHVDMSIKALQAGKHLLCEKPLGINSAECLKLLEAVRRSDLITSCSNYRLYSKQFKTTQQIMQSGECGELLGGWAHDEENYFNPGNAPLLKSYGKSPILSFGFYLLNIAQTLFGMPEAVFARMSSFNCRKQENYDIDDLENVILCYPGGKQFTLTLNMTANAPLRHAYQFYFAKGRIYWPHCPPHFNRPIRLLTAEKGEVELPASLTPSEDAKLPNWHLPMIDDFVRSVQSNTQPLCSIESAVKTALVTDAIIKSADSGKLEAVIWED
jgi:predicted dehydrogenase